MPPFSEAKIVGRTLRYGEPYLLWTRVSCELHDFAVGKNCLSYHVGESENGAYFHFILCFPCFPVFFWWSGGFGGNDIVWPMFGESHTFILWTNVFWFTANFGVLLEENHDASPKTFQIFPINHWLVVWNMTLIFPYIGKNNPNWLIFFRGLKPPTRPLLFWASRYCWKCSCLYMT